MNLLAAIQVGWFAVHVFAALISVFLYLRRRQLEYLAYTCIAVSLAGYCAGAAILTDALEENAAAVGQNLEYCCSAITFVAYALFGYATVGRPAGVLVRTLIPVALVMLPMMGAGLLVDPAIATAPTGGFDYRDAGLAPSTYVGGAVAITFGIWVLFELGRGFRRSRESRVLAGAVALTLAGWVHDISMRAFGFESVYLTEHLGSLGGLLVSYLLLDRFADTAKALRRRTLELRHRYDELRHVQEELVRKEQLAAVGELSAVIAHEVRNPLAILRNAAAGLRKETIGEDDRATLLAVLDEETDRLNRLVRDLLAYARPVEPQLAQLELATLVRRAVDAAGTVMSHVGFEPDVDMARLAGHIDGDKDLLERVFAQIIANAMQAMPDGGTLTVESEPCPMPSGPREGQPAIAISFEDTGEGMDTLVRSRAVDPFFTTRPSGTGLGLAIVQRIVKAHGGVVDLQSTSEGSRVSIYLPRASESAEKS